MPHGIVEDRRDRFTFKKGCLTGFRKNLQSHRLPRPEGKGSDAFAVLPGYLDVTRVFLLAQLADELLHADEIGAEVLEDKLRPQGTRGDLDLGRRELVHVEKPLWLPRQGKKLRHRRISRH